jgi:unsaturated chondroitin disaccharide hydrolase
LEAPYWWTAGFWPGLLWLLYSENGNDDLRHLAEQCEDQLDQVIQDYYRLDHDIGFMWTLTSLARYKLLKQENSKRRAFLAANLLAARFNIQGRYIRAWNPWREGEDNAGLAIIDCTMNLPLLFWASSIGGDPRYRHVAEAHLETVLEHFIRPDGSVYHIVNFDPFSGACVEKHGGQGLAAESAWSRGAAWAIYGLTLGYHHTGHKIYLDAAKRVTHFFMAHLPEDHVPYWDFRLPADHPGRFRDSSAGACAASGLLLLSEKVSEVEAPIYRNQAIRMLESLYKNYGAWEDRAQEGLILHGTSNFPEEKNIDVPLIYGDYFFVEGLARLKGMKDLFWQ